MSIFFFLNLVDVAIIEKKLEDARQMVDKLGEGQLGDEEVEDGVKQRGEKEGKDISIFLF